MPAVRRPSVSYLRWKAAMQKVRLSLDMLRHRLAHRLKWNLVSIAYIDDGPTIRVRVRCAYCQKEEWI